MKGFLGYVRLSSTVVVLMTSCIYCVPNEYVTPSTCDSIGVTYSGGTPRKLSLQRCGETVSLHAPPLEERTVSPRIWDASLSRLREIGVLQNREVGSLAGARDAYWCSVSAVVDGEEHNAAGWCSEVSRELREVITELHAAWLDDRAPLTNAGAN